MPVGLGRSSVIKPARQRADGTRSGFWRSRLSEKYLERKGYGTRWAVESFFSGLETDDGFDVDLTQAGPTVGRSRLQGARLHSPPLAQPMQSGMVSTEQHGFSFGKAISIRTGSISQSPGIEAIFCGLDLTGHHIFVVNNSANVVCHDVVGFAAIGIGYWHANSQFMFAEHHWQKSFSETLLLTYSAKKRAEVAPGVGAETDMFAIGPNLGEHTPTIGNHVLDKLQEIYDETRKKHQQSNDEAEVAASEYVSKIVENANIAKKQQESTSTPSPTVHAPCTETTTA